MKKLILTFILWFSLFVTFSSLAQNNQNYTDNIKVEVEENKEDWLLKYTITQSFSEFSQAKRGIFFDINNNQDNVMYDFRLAGKPTINGKPVKYEAISELTSLRIRFGDKDVLLDPGIYEYQFQLKTKVNTDNNHDFTFFYDWKDLLNSANIFYKGEDICLKQDCINSPKITLNPNKPKANAIISLLQQLQAYIWVIAGTMVLWFSTLKNKFTDRYRLNHTENIPFYTSPKEMKPWELESIIKKGKLEVKNTLAAYILYLNHKNYLKIIPKTKEDNLVKINLLQELPTNWLPEGYNKIIQSMVTHGVEKGILESQVLEFKLDDETENFILKNNELLYISKPTLQPAAITFIVTIIGGVLLTLLYFLIRSYFLIGTSAFIFIGFCFLLSMIFLFLYLFNKDKFNQEGYDIFKEATGYKYYISSIESEKLDFDNNPDEGAKFYLANVPYAAQFGVLDKFNKYFKSLTFMQPETYQTGMMLSNSLSYSTFYIPPTDSSGGGFGGGGGGFSGGGGSW